MSTAAPVRATSSTQLPQETPAETLGQIQSLAQRIQAMLPAEPGRGHVLGVTSCSRQEGVSAISANLAACASELYSGRVLLVDANPRHASVARRFGVQRTPGLADCLSGKLAIQQCITGTTRTRLNVLPAGSAVDRMSRYSDELARELFDRLRRDFELIIVDLPPAGEMDQTLLASRLVDGFLLVLEAERIRRQVAQRVKRQFDQVGARLLGVVLNKRKNHIPDWLYHRL